jgi:AcrR family transcriptional regulator
MPPQEDSRKRLVQTALKLFSARGYYHTAIADILKESGVTRGSLYYHFPSKKELGFAAIDEGVRLLVEQGVVRHLRTKGHPVDRLLKVLDDLPSVVRLETIDSSASDVSVQMACVDEDFQKWLQRATGAMVDELEGVLSRGIADGQIVDSVDPRVLAHVVTVVAQGIQLTSLLGQREIIWKDARRWLKEYLNSLRK